MGYNRAGARLRLRRKRRRNLERIYRETHCHHCGDDERSDLFTVWDDAGTREIARLCSVCNAYYNLEVFKKNGLLKEDLFVFAWEGLPHWDTPEEERDAQKIPFFDEASARALAEINNRIVHKAAEFVNQVWPGLQELSLSAPVLVGTAQRVEMIVTDWMQEGTPYITLQEKTPAFRIEPPSLTFALFNGEGEYEGRLVVEITDISCTERQAHDLLDRAIRSPPDCKPVAA